MMISSVLPCSNLLRLTMKWDRRAGLVEPRRVIAAGPAHAGEGCLEHIANVPHAWDHGSVLRVAAYFRVRGGDGPAYGLAGSGARMPKMWQMASVSLARLSV